MREEPKNVEKFYKRGHYYFALVDQVAAPQEQDTGITVSVDMGEIHQIVIFDGRRPSI